MSKNTGRDFFPTQRDYHEVFTDFSYYVTADTFTTTATDGGSAAVSDGVAGFCKVYPSSAENSEGDNEETYLHGTHETFLFADGKPMVFETRVRPLFNTATGINIFCGLMNAVAANSIQDSGAGPKADYHGFGFFLKDGDATWYAESSIGTSQTTVDTNITATNNTWTELRIEVHDRSSTQNELHYFIDGVECGFDVTTSVGNKIAQKVTFADASEMEICLGVKNGVADDSQWMDVDDVGCRQTR